jgi:outer membrane biosynthesis protein TonB
VAGAAPAAGAWLGGWLGLSVILHAVVLTALFLLTARATTSSPPIYRVDIVAAPPGPRAVGVVTPAPPPDTRSPIAPPAPPLPSPQLAPRAKTAPVKAPPKARPARATPVPPPITKPAPTKQAPARAAGGPTGGQGTDVATVQTAGIDFPYPGYLNNIVRQVALNFSPDNRSTALRAEVAFLIRRDGSVIGFRFVTRSGDYGFDLEAQGAIEKAGPSFGPLPDGFTEDALPVLFSFDPRLLQ